MTMGSEPVGFFRLLFLGQALTDLEGGFATAIAAVPMPAGTEACARTDFQLSFP
jgi:hypothetical protein